MMTCALDGLSLGSFDELPINEVPERNLDSALEYLCVERMRECLHGGGKPAGSPADVLVRPL
jgi:hypothetical protein